MERTSMALQSAEPCAEALCGACAEPCAELSVRQSPGWFSLCFTSISSMRCLVALLKYLNGATDGQKHTCSQAYCFVATLCEFAYFWSQSERQRLGVHLFWGSWSFTALRHNFRGHSVRIRLFYEANWATEGRSVITCRLSFCSHSLRICLFYESTWATEGGSVISCRLTFCSHSVRICLFYDFLYCGIIISRHLLWAGVLVNSIVLKRSWFWKHQVWSFSVSYDAV